MKKFMLLAMIAIVSIKGMAQSSDGAYPVGKWVVSNSSYGGEIIITRTGIGRYILSASACGTIKIQDASGKSIVDCVLVYRGKKLNTDYSGTGVFNFYYLDYNNKLCDISLKKYRENNQLKLKIMKGSGGIENQPWLNLVFTQEPYMHKGKEDKTTEALNDSELLKILSVSGESPYGYGLLPDYVTQHRGLSEYKTKFAKCRQDSVLKIYQKRSVKSVIVKELEVGYTTPVVDEYEGWCQLLLGESRFGWVRLNDVTLSNNAGSKTLVAISKAQPNKQTKGETTSKMPKETKYSTVLLNKAKAGNAESQYLLGVCYYEGKGIAVNQSEAKNWLEKASKKGHVGAKTYISTHGFSEENKAIDSGSKGDKTKFVPIHRERSKPDFRPEDYEIYMETNSSFSALNLPQIYGVRAPEWWFVGDPHDNIPHQNRLCYAFGELPRTIDNYIFPLWVTYWMGQGGFRNTRSYGQDGRGEEGAKKYNHKLCERQSRKLKEEFDKIVRMLEIPTYAAPHTGITVKGGFQICNIDGWETKSYDMKDYSHIFVQLKAHLFVSHGNELFKYIDYGAIFISSDQYVYCTDHISQSTNDYEPDRAIIYMILNEDNAYVMDNLAQIVIVDKKSKTWEIANTQSNLIISAYRKALKKAKDKKSDEYRRADSVRQKVTKSGTPTTR